MAVKTITTGFKSTVGLKNTGDNSYITGHQTLNVLNAGAFSHGFLKKPLNTYLVVNFAVAKNWMLGRRTRSQYRKVRESFLHALRDWCDRANIKPLYIYSDENPPGGGAGPHINILIHLPPENWVDLRASLFGCLRKTGGWSLDDCPDEKRTDARRKGIHIEPSAAKGPMDLQNSMRVTRYILKGANPDEIVEHNGKRQTLGELPGSELNEPIKLEPQGNVQSSRRAGASLALGMTSRKKAGWIDEANFTQLSGYLNHHTIRSMALSILKAWPLPRQGGISGGADIISDPKYADIGKALMASL